MKDNNKSQEQLWKYGMVLFAILHVILLFISLFKLDLGWILASFFSLFLAKLFGKVWKTQNERNFN